MYLSLPLPTEPRNEINVVFVPYLPSQRQLKMTIQLKKETKVSELKQEIENKVASLSLSRTNEHSVGFKQVVKALANLV
jgi:hypothetical protein